MEKIVITVYNGIVEVENIPESLRGKFELHVRDYDEQDMPSKEDVADNTDYGVDGDGQVFAQSIYNR